MSVHAISSLYRKFWPSSKSFSSLRNSNDTKRFTCEDFQWEKRKDTFESAAQFSVTSFNMLAPCYKRLHIRDEITGRRMRESHSMDMWNTRANDTLKFFQEEIFNKNTSIVALQEFWLDNRYSNMFEKRFAENGYDVKLLQRTGPKVDAVALMIKTDTFEILGSENVYLCSLADRVALMLWLRHTESGKHVIIANTHLSFPHNAIDRLNQMRQMQNLTSFMDRFAAEQNISKATRVILGDFNVEGQSPVCDHLRNAGYYSCCEVSAPNNVKPPKGFVPPVKSRKLDSTILKLLNIENDTCEVSEHRIANCNPVEFISHHTHQHEDLGVDHIFVKPECNFENHEVIVEDEILTQLETQKKILQETVFVCNTTVLPHNISCAQWHSEFGISDHRPVEAKIAFGKRIKSKNK